MSCPDLLTQTDGVQNYLSTTTTSTPASAGILSCFKLGRSVHPLEPVAPEHSEFLEISSRRRIRIIHIKPDETTSDKKQQHKKHKENNAAGSTRRSFRLSTEEYWFTRWNRPMRTTICNCSFRRSQRFSKYHDDRLSLTSNNRHSSNNDQRNSTVITTTTAATGVRKNSFKIDNYVDKLLCDILVAAFKEYSLINSNNRFDLTNGIVNLAYKSTDDDEVDTSVFIKCKNVININDSKDQSIKVQNNFIESNNCMNDVTLRTKHKKTDKKKCEHSSHYEKKKKPMVFLLHGIGSSAEVWWDVLQCLVCAGYEIVAPDMLGHGYSSVPDSAKAYSFSNLLKDTISIFDKYVSNTELEQCIVIGHSFGCSLATALARYREQQVVQLVLISGGGPTPLAPPVTSPEVSVFSCMQCVMRPLLFCGVKRTMFYSSRGKHFDACESQTAVPSYVLRYIMEGQNWPEGDAAFHRRILIPTLLVHGLQDSSVTLVQECEMERTIPRSFLEVIPTAGHLAMVETPEQLCHMLLCFFQWWSK